MKTSPTSLAKKLLAAAALMVITPLMLLALAGCGPADTQASGITGTWNYTKFSEGDESAGKVTAGFINFTDEGTALIAVGNDDMVTVYGSVYSLEDNVVTIKLDSNLSSATGMSSMLKFDLSGDTMSSEDKGALKKADKTPALVESVSKYFVAHEQTGFSYTINADGSWDVTDGNNTTAGFWIFIKGTVNGTDITDGAFEMFDASGENLLDFLFVTSEGLTSVNDMQGGMGTGTGTGGKTGTSTTAPSGTGKGTGTGTGTPSGTGTGDDDNMLLNKGIGAIQGDWAYVGTGAGASLNIDGTSITLKSVSTSNGQTKVNTDGPYTLKMQSLDSTGHEFKFTFSGEPDMAYYFTLKDGQNWPDCIYIEMGGEMLDDAKYMPVS